MKQNWRIAKPRVQYNETDTMTAKILKIRGIENPDRFLNPSESDVISPWHLSNMKEAVHTIVKAINNKNKVGIYADIDCDGVTSAAIMYKYLKNFNTDIHLLSHQRKDGHGVIVENVPSDIDLLIIVDSSSNSVDECQALSQRMDIVILDHHQIEKDNPYATIVNPQYNDYTNKHLSGAGIVYKTCKAIDEVMMTFYADDYIDICAVGLIGDMMDVTNPETRYLILKGLLKIHNNCNPSLFAILKHLKKEYKPNATTIAFYLAPFINAIIRLGKIEDILEILITEDADKLKELIKKCGGINDKRKSLQSDIIEQIDSIIELNHKIIIVNVSSLNVNSTMNGLIANSVAQKYQKPTLIVSLDEDTGLLTGSGRGYGNDFSFKNVLSETRLFETVEGHDSAFGVEFKVENLNSILSQVDDVLDHVKQEYIIEADMLLGINEISWDLLYEIQRLSFITGQGFKDPLFVVEGLPVGEVKVMKDVHLKFGADELECVKFNVTPEEIKGVEETLFVDVLGTLSVNSWYHFGKKEVIKSKQLMVEDMETY